MHCSIIKIICISSGILTQGILIKNLGSNFLKHGTLFHIHISKHLISITGQEFLWLQMNASTHKLRASIILHFPLSLTTMSSKLQMFHNCYTSPKAHLNPKHTGY